MAKTTTVGEIVYRFIQNNPFEFFLIGTLISGIVCTIFYVLLKRSENPNIILSSHDSYKLTNLGRFKEEVYDNETEEYILKFKRFGKIKECRSKLSFEELQSLSYTSPFLFSKYIMGVLINANNIILLDPLSLERKDLEEFKLICLDINDKQSPSNASELKKYIKKIQCSYCLKKYKYDIREKNKCFYCNSELEDKKV